jgi:hypothetical protein
VSAELQVVVKDVDYDDIESSIKLSSAYFKEGHPCLQRSYLEWLYLRNPHGRASMAIATLDDAWIGMTALVPVALTKAGVIQRARYAANVLSHPEHRDKNVFIKLIKAIGSAMSLQGEWLLGHPNKLALPGWKRQKMAFREALRPYLLLPNLGMHPGKLKKVCTFSELQDLSFDHIPNGHGWKINYGADFFKWRYLDSPIKSYEIHAYETGDSLNLFVTRPYRRGVILMVDWTSSSVLKIGHTFLPSLCMLPEEEARRNDSARLIRLPSNREIPFFLTTYGPALPSGEFFGVSLGASDF